MLFRSSSGSERAIIIWLHIVGHDSFFDDVLPQWKPINTSFGVYGNLSLISALYMSEGTVLLISRRVTISSLTTVPINSLHAPYISTSQETGIPIDVSLEFT